ncbi:MAG: hypothetical protein ACE15D_18710 [Candidatus Eisenbacteria bacterium]
MLALLKSVAAYLSETTLIGPGQRLSQLVNEATRGDAAAISSSAATGSELAWLTDGQAGQAFATDVDDDPCYVGLTWSALLWLDGIRFRWPAGSTPPTVKLQTWDGASWADESGSPSHLLVAGWNMLTLLVSARVRGIRVVYVSGGDDVRLRCSEIEAYQDLRSEPRPTSWASGSVHAVHPDSDLSHLVKDAAVVTVGAVASELGIGEQGSLSHEERPTVWVGIHARSEEELALHLRWARLALGLASSMERDGSYSPGLPLRGIQHPLIPVAGGDWWSSGQREWYDTPAPVVRVEGVVTEPTTIDYGRGRVELPGVSDSANVRADFVCGVWPFALRTLQGSTIESVAQMLHRHNAYLSLEGESWYRPVASAIG